MPRQSQNGIGGDGPSLAATPGLVGARVLRREDARLLTGCGRYVSDATVPNLLHVAFVRSPHAHALITSIDVERARRVPGVVAVITGADIAGLVRPLRATSGTPGYRACDTPILPGDRVRMVGEPVVLVVASGRYQAEDGVDAVHIAWEPLPPLLSIEDALAPGAAAIHADAPENLFNRFEERIGDVDAAFADADHVIELELRQQRYSAVAMEGRVVLASFDKSRGALTAWLSSQVPHLARTGLARHLNLPENRVHVIAPDIGGGFGPKCVIYPEDLAVSAASILLGRPLKWVSDRVEDLQSTVHGREQTSRVRAAADQNGRVLAVAAELSASNGAYAPWPYTAGLDSGQASENVTGPYDIPIYERRVRAVVTNKAPMGPYRGVGRVIACLTIERVMDELAARLGLDPLEVRRRNLVREFPHTTATGLRFESGDYLRMLDMLEQGIEWPRLREENRAQRAQGCYRGVGAAFVVEHSAYGPKTLAKRQLTITPGYDTAALRMEPDGKLRVAVGLHNHGQGHETTIAQIAGQELGLGVEDIEVVYGDTDVVPYGLGTWASRSTVACGGATILAARDLRARLLELAADMLEANPEDLELKDGAACLRGSPSRRVELSAIARRAHHEPHLLPDGIEPGLEVTRHFEPPDPGSFASAVHAAQVEVDLSTGAIRILRYVVVEDCGTMVNPMIIDGQVQGGVAQGVGGALFEHLVYDATGSLLTTSLMDYLLPGAPETPHIEVLHLESPSPHVPGGFKGMGEGGAIPAPAAIVAAVNDALADLGVVANHTPLTPEWVLSAVAEARAAGRGVPEMSTHESRQEAEPA
jgi:carbon-monoxide dehydrogenase large subunit